MKSPFFKILPSRLMVVSLGTTLFVLCVAAILLLLPGFIARERLVDHLTENLHSLGSLKSGDSPENLDHMLLAIVQSNRTNRDISYLRFVDLGDRSLFSYDEKGARTAVGRVEPDVWADLIKKGRSVKFDAERYEVFRILSPELPIAVNLGIDPEVAHEMESQRRLSTIVGSIILATGIGILIMIWQTRQIEEAKGELELVLANTSEPIIMVDNYCRLVFANEPARTLLGHPKGKPFKNRPLLSLIQNNANRQFFEKLLASEQSEVDELETTLAGYPEKVTFRAGAMDVKTSVGRKLGKLLVLWDVTLEKRLEDKKVSQTIHELKGMLGEVKGFIRHALDTMDRDSQREQRAFLNICLEKLERSYDTVAAMVKSIVSAFKPQSLELRPRHCDLAEIIRLNVNDFESSLEREKVKGLSIRTSLPDKLPTVCCDPNAVSRVLMNLLQNAFQHCPQDTIEVGAEEQGEAVQVLVKDTGCGIPPGNLDIIFEPHVSFRRGGTGLGLSICRDFIRAHGGEIWAHSDGKDKGSAFYFTLPKSRPVILTSDAKLAANLHSQCKKSGYYAISVDDFLAATRKVVEINPNAILLDIDMQDTISGISLAYRLKKTGETAKIPIIGFTSNVPFAQAELDRYEGITLEAFLQRDFAEEDLRAAMRTVEAYWYLTQSA